jgi:hypothetical protein
MSKFNIEDLLNDDDEIPGIKISKKELEEFGIDDSNEEFRCVNDDCRKVLDIDPNSELAKEIRDNVVEESGYFIGICCKDCATS